MHRFIVKPTDIKNHSVLLNEKESHHAIKVLRLGVGDAVQLMDGKGSAEDGFISSLEGGRVHVSLNPRSNKAKAKGVHITLASALIKADRMEWSIEKACELGVAEIRPVLTGRCVVRLDADERVSKQKRWQKIAEASCKQCGLSAIPEVHVPQKWDDFLRSAKSYDLRLIASLSEGAVPLRSVLTAGATPGTVVMAVGPEGDFTEAETASALEADFIPVSLGDLVMRSETAAIYALSALQYQYSHKP